MMMMMKRLVFVFVLLLALTSGRKLTKLHKSLKAGATETEFADWHDEFVNNPATFIGEHRIVVDVVDELMNAAPVAGITTDAVISTDAANDEQIPKLRLAPANKVVNGEVVVPGGKAKIFKTMWLPVSRVQGNPSAEYYAASPYVDIAVAPGGDDTKYVFTQGMNGCALIIVSAVPEGAPALAEGKWRVFHDPRHAPVGKFQALGYTVHVAAYAGATEATDGDKVPYVDGVAPAHVINYNPHDYPWSRKCIDGGGPLGTLPLTNAYRVVTNFLYWVPGDAPHWAFGSRHYFTTTYTGGAHIYLSNDPPIGKEASSTQNIKLA
jgi:hypothetical protein